MKTVTRTMSLWCVAAVVAAICVPAWGYGISGLRDSADFSNDNGPWPTGGKQTYEGDLVGGVITDSLGGGFSEYGTANMTKTASASVLNLAWPNTSAYEGFYQYQYPNSWPDVTADTGLTLEWRMKINSMSLWGGSNGLYIGLRDGAKDWYAYIKPGQIIGSGGLDASIADISQWHNYRLAVLGKDGNGERRANFYIDSDLVASGITTGNSTEKILWAGVTWGDYTGVDVSYDYIRMDTTGGYAPVPEPISLSLFALAGIGLLRRKRA